MPDIKISFRRASKAETSQITANNMGLRDMLYSRSKPLVLSTVYRCVDLLSDALAVLPLITYNLDEQGFKTEAKDNSLYTLLNLEPNGDMTRYTFFKTLMTSVLLTGNAYAYIERDRKLRVEQLIYIPSHEVTIEFITDGRGIKRKRYRVNGFNELVEPKDMLHFMNFSPNGIVGVSTLTHAAQTLNITMAAEEHTAGFFEGGGGVSGVLTVEGPRLKREQKDDIYQTWAERMSPSSARRSPIAVLEGNMKYQPISISPKDATLIETRQFQVIDICRFFGVSPVKAFDLSKSSYNTVEATQLQYLVDSVLPILTKFEQEINRKVLLPGESKRTVIEYDTSVILRTDKTAEAAYMRDMTYIGAVTPNEVRRRMNLSPLKDGDTAFVQVNMQPLTLAANPPKQEVKKTNNRKKNE